MTKSSRSRHGGKDTTYPITLHINNDMQSKRTRFKKMKPRVGGHHQTKVPKFVVKSVSQYQSLRPKPERISIQHGYSYSKEFQEKKKEEGHDFHESQSKTNDHPWLDPTIPNRSGGTCIHKESLRSQVNQFIHCAQSNLSHKLEQSSTSCDNFYESVFCQDMISNYGNTSSGTRHRKKRRAAAEWTPCLSLVRRCNSELPAREEEEFLLQFFSFSNIETAELDLRVQLSNGTARKARRILQKTRHSNRFKQPSLQSSASWRQRLEPTTLWGDLRSDTVILSHPYNMNHEANCSRLSETTAAATSIEDMKGVWRSILAYGQAMERAMNTSGDESLRNTSNNRRPCRTEVMNFIRNVYALSAPEETFGSRHICVEEISTCMHNLLDNLSAANVAMAEILDFLADDVEGVNMEVLRKLLDKIVSFCPMELDDEVVLRKQIKISSEWQEKLDTLMSTNTNHTKDDDMLDHMEIAVDLVNQAHSQSNIRTSGLVILGKKLEKAQHLEERLTKMGNGMTVKFIAALVREANRINIPSRRVQELRKFYKELECWVDRANIAIRSRISLSEIESLILRGETMPVNLNEFLDKLRSRVRMGRSWITRLEDEVPRVYKEDGCTMDEIGWMRQMRLALTDDKKGGAYGYLQELCSEGARVPVEILCMKMLQIEIDAKNWMNKAKKWHPRDGEISKKPKIEELREHILKAESLRDRIPVDQKDNWILEYETKMRSTVNAADTWYDEYQPFLDWDNRRNSERSRLSLEKLRQIVKRGTAIHVNIGNSMTKMSKVLEQAETWYEMNKSLLARANVLSIDDFTSVEHSVNLSELTDAISTASSRVSVDLEEALALQKIADQIRRWLERVCNAAPIKRSKRVGKGRWSCKPTRFSMKDLVDLIEEGKSLPIPTNEEVVRLNTQLEEVQAWRLKAHGELKTIANAFCSLRSLIESVHGSLNSFCDEETVSSSVINVNEIKSPKKSRQVMDAIDSTKRKVGDYESNTDIDDVSTNYIEAKINHSKSQHFPKAFISCKDIGSNNEVVRLISSLLNEARQTGVMTAEEELLKNLDDVSTWCCKSLKALDNKNELFEKKAYLNFNTLVLVGKKILQSPDAKSVGIDSELSQLLRKNWSLLVEEQLTRLEKLGAHRDEFIKWSKAAQSIIAAKDKKITIEAVKELTQHSRKYPSSADIVQKIQSLFQRVSKWQDRANSQIYSREKRLNMQEAKALCEEGDKLKLVCQELKVLRNAIRSSRSWLNRLKKCRMEQQSGLCASEAEKLMLEHNNLLVVMPEEVERLEQAMKGYCVCRRPYEGFMIGCDSCDEWYHGPCIGVSETQADRFEKYLCVRCCVKKVFKSSSTIVAGVIKKWTSDKDRKKARQAQYQKHQRKVRKERKDIEKSDSQILELREQLQKDNLKPWNDTSANLFLSEVNPGQEKQTTSPSKAGKNGLSTSTYDGNLNLSSGMSNHCVAGSELNDSDPSSQTEAKKAKAPAIKVKTKKECNIAAADSKKVQGASIRYKEVKIKIMDLERAICSCNKRLHFLHLKATERSEMDKEEDRFSQQLKIWCIRARSNILVPSTPQRAELSKPLSHGRLSTPMIDIFRDAEFLGIARFSDFQIVANSLKSLCWSSFMMATLTKKPTLKEMQHLLNISSQIDLPDEKAVRMLKSMVQRTIQWQSKARKGLLPKPGETKPFNVDVLRSIAALGSGIPFEVPETGFLCHAIEDKGIRYCRCGGANDGTFMLSCDKCEKWFHGRCVNIDKVTGCNLENWTCPFCVKNKKLVEFKMDLEKWFDFVDEDQNNTTPREYAPNAPTIEKMWPPFKLFGSEESRAVLGETCLSIPDEVGYIAGLDDISSESPLIENISQRPPTVGQPQLAKSLSIVDTKYSDSGRIQEEKAVPSCISPLAQNGCRKVHLGEKSRLYVVTDNQIHSDLSTKRFMQSPPNKHASPKRMKYNENAISYLLKSAVETNIDYSEYGPSIAKQSREIQNVCICFNSSENTFTSRQDPVNTLFQKPPRNVCAEQAKTAPSLIRKEGKPGNAHSSISKTVLPENCLHLNAQVRKANTPVKSFNNDRLKLDNIKGNIEENIFIVSPQLNGSNETQVLETENEILRVSCKS